MVIDVANINRCIVLHYSKGFKKEKLVVSIRIF